MSPWRRVLTRTHKFLSFLPSHPHLSPVSSPSFTFEGLAHVSPGRESVSAACACAHNAKGSGRNGRRGCLQYPFQDYPRISRPPKRKVEIIGHRRIPLHFFLYFLFLFSPPLFSFSHSNFGMEKIFILSSCIRCISFFNFWKDLCKMMIDHLFCIFLCISTLFFFFAFN